MTSPATPDRDFFRLLSRLDEGLLAPAEVRDLESRLRADASLRRDYLDFMFVVGGLSWERQGEFAAITLPQSSRHNPRAVTEVEKRSVISSPLSVGEESPSTSSQRTTDNGPFPPFRNPHSAFRIPHSFQSHPLAFSLFVSTVATVLFLLTAAQVRVGGDSPRRDGQVASTPPLLPFVARFIGEQDCVWSDESTAPIVGAHLREGQSLDLRSGVVRVSFDSGAMALVEGPAKFVLQESNKGRLDAGRLVARVEKREAKGFTVATPTATIVDLGTEFGVQVEADGTTEVHTFSGRVQATRCASGQVVVGETLDLTVGKAARFGRELGQLLAMKADGARFEPMREAMRSEGERRWPDYMKEMQSDARLVAYYPLGNPVLDKADRLKNQAPAAEEGLLDIELHGVGWSSGRWPGSRALKFGGAFSRHHAEIRGSEQAMNFDGAFSFAVWFRADRYDTSFQPLVTKGDDSWRLHRWIETNHLTFDTTSGMWRHHLRSRNEVSTRRWHFVVCVVKPNARQGLSKFMYVDGYIQSGDYAKALDANDEPVWIGGNSDYPERVFAGEIDELAFYKGALSDDDVRRLYELGCPYEPLPPKDFNTRPREDFIAPEEYPPPS